MLMPRDAPHVVDKGRLDRAHLLVGIRDESEQRLHVEALDGDAILAFDQCQVVPLVCLGSLRAQIGDTRNRRAARAIAIERQCLAENRG